MKRSLGFLLLGLAACSPAGGGPGHPEKPDLAVAVPDLGGPADLAAPADLGVAPALRLQIVTGQPGSAGYVNDTGAAARLDMPSGVAADGAGKLYVADAAETIRVVTLATGAVALLAGRPGVYGQLNGPAARAEFGGIGDLMLDRGTGTLLVTEGGGYATIRRIQLSTGLVDTIAGDGQGQRGSVDGTGSAALFDGISGAVKDAAGNLYVSDSRNQTIRKVVLATGAVTTFAGSTGMQGSADGVGAAARFNGPGKLALDGAGNLYVTDGGNHLVRKIVLATATVSTLAGVPGTTGGSVDGTGSAARLNKPAGLAFDAGRLIVSEVGSHTLRTVTLPDGTVTALAGLAGTPGRTDGTGSAARFTSPGGLTADGAGNVYVSDRGNHAVRKVVLATAAVTTVAGTGPLPGATDGPATVARFSGPTGVIADAAGNAYVADGSNHTIRKVVLATGAVSTLAGVAGTPGSTDGTGSAARFKFPYALALDGAGSLFVVESDSNTVRRIDLATAAVTTLAGLAGSTGSADGVGSAARFDFPRGIVADGAGSLYVADEGNSTIRKIAIATGTVTTVAGVAGYSGNRDGIGMVTFTQPSGLALDGAGNLYIGAGTLVRKLALGSGAVTTVVGARTGGEADGWTTSPDGGPATFPPIQSLAMDGAGVLYAISTPPVLGTRVYKIDLVARRVTTVIGAERQRGFRAGPPAGIGHAGGLCVTPAGELLLTDSQENVLLRGR